MDRLGVDRARAVTIMHDYGYTGSACIPMALDQNGTGRAKSKPAKRLFSSVRVVDWRSTPHCLTCEGSTLRWDDKKNNSKNNTQEYV